MQNTDFQITHRVITIIETNRKQGYSAQTEWKSARQTRLQTEAFSSPQPFSHLLAGGALARESNAEPFDSRAKAPPGK